MNISEIVSITPNGKPYESQYGLLYPFLVSFSDNTSGTVNTKTAQPPYKVGDRVGYEVTGDFRGVSKLKISKNPDKAFGGTPPPQIQPAKPFPPLKTPQQLQDALDRPEIEAINPVFGATVGMAMNNSLELLTKGLEHDEVIERIITPEFWKSVWEVSSDQIRVARELEKGRLAPSPTERQKRATGFKTASTGHPDSHPDLEAADSALPF